MANLCTQTERERKKHEKPHKAVDYIGCSTYVPYTPL